MDIIRCMKKFNLISILLLLPLPSFAFDCHPEINPNLPQYIVGYGSLMDESSKKRTDPSTEESVPVLVKGYKRIPLTFRLRVAVYFSSDVLHTTPSIPGVLLPFAV